VNIPNLTALPIESLAPSTEIFAFHSHVHGQPHVSRVIIHTLLLVDALGYEDYGPSAWAAAYIHDIGRRNDDICREHGRYSMERLETLPEIKSLLEKGGVTPEDWEGITFAVENHCRPDIPRTHPYWTLTAILKDADGLDRVRLGDLVSGLLRFPQSRALVPFATALYEQTHEIIKPGPDYFSNVWSIALDVLNIDRINI
jgi:hypothetical protein